MPKKKLELLQIMSQITIIARCESNLLQSSILNNLNSEHVCCPAKALGYNGELAPQFSIALINDFNVQDIGIYSKKALVQYRLKTKERVIIYSVFSSMESKLVNFISQIQKMVCEVLFSEVDVMNEIFGCEKSC